MKKIFFIGFILVFTLINEQLMAQMPLEGCLLSGGASDMPAQYRQEIMNRFTDNPNPWLTWDGDENQGEGFLDCAALLDAITDEHTGIALGNFVILNDQNSFGDEIMKDKRFWSDTDGDGIDDDVINGDGDADDDDDDYVYLVRNRSYWPRYFYEEPEAGEPEAGIRFFLLTPGDYRDYESLLLYNQNTDQKKYILYYDGPVGGDFLSADIVRTYFENHLCQNSSDPTNQLPQKQAIIERFEIDQASGNWVINGLTVRGNHYSYPVDNEPQTGGMYNKIVGGGNNVIRSCLFENLTGAKWLSYDNEDYEYPNGQLRSHGAYYIYMDNSDNNIIADCTFRNKNECIDASKSIVDMMGIFIQGGTLTSSNNMIFGNYMQDVGDAIQLMPSSFCDEETKGAPGTLIYNNELYNRKFYDVSINNDDCTFERMNGEGAIDLKMGAGFWGQINQGTGQFEISDELPICEKVIIANNKISGWRGSKTRNSDGNFGGTGDAIHMHANAKNIVVINNEITDCAVGISVAGDTERCLYDDDDDIYTDPVPMYANSILSTEHIEIYKNSISNLYPTVSDYLCSWGCFFQNEVHSSGITINSNHNIKVIGNTIHNSVRGIDMDGDGGQATIENNYISGIHREFFDGGISFSGFRENTYRNFISVCSGNSQNDPPPEVLDVNANNSFLCPNGNAIPVENICNPNCQ